MIFLKHLCEHVWLYVYIHIETQKSLLGRELHIKSVCSLVILAAAEVLKFAVLLQEQDDVSVRSRLKAWRSCCALIPGAPFLCVWCPYTCATP